VYSKTIHQILKKYVIFLVSMAAVVLSASHAAQREPAATGHLVKHGIVVDFEAFPVGDAAEGLMEGQLAEMRFRLTEEATGKRKK